MLQSSIRLSVVIPTWNAVDLVSEALEHLTKDGCPPWAELIVVDDGSKDETAGLIRSRFGAVQVIEHGVNRGFGAAVNTGFRAAKGGFLSAVNNDARVSWDCLERLVRFLQEHHGAGAAAPLILDGAGRGQRVGFDFPRPPWQRPLRLARRSATARPEGGADAPYEAEYVRGACVVFRRAALDQAGLFDEQFHMFAEEIDLFRRLARVGWHAWVVPEATATHLAGVSTRNHSDPVVASRFRRQSYRSICLYYRKHHNWATAAVLRGLLAARVSLRLVGSLLPTALRSGPRRSSAEHIACLAVVLRPCRSRPIEPSLPSVSGGDGGR